MRGRLFDDIMNIICSPFRSGPGGIQNVGGAGKKKLWKNNETKNPNKIN